MKVVKHSGDVVNFDRRKLQSSLEASGADPARVEEILHLVDQQLFEGISTRKIYRIAFGLLKKKSKATAARYNLKLSIQALGPAGFFFEKFMARLFEKEGYQTMVGQKLQGKSVSHEIDVLLLKENVLGFVECKFHSNKDTKSDVKIPMYILSRFNDLKHNEYFLFNQNYFITEARIVTNTHFSSDALKFGNDYGLILLGWDYPVNQGIKNKIDAYKLYPITCLTTLSSLEKEKLLIQDCILVKDIIEDTNVLYQIDIHNSRIKNIIKEATELCGYFNAK